jgi:hypothetical protein
MHTGLWLEWSSESASVDGRSGLSWLQLSHSEEEESRGSWGTIQTVAGGEELETDHISVNRNKNKRLSFKVLCFKLV